MPHVPLHVPDLPAGVALVASQIPRSIKLEREESRLAIRGNPQIDLQGIASKGTKSGKFDYLCAPSHSAHSMASEFSRTTSQ
jgi:hypothetical protein